MEPVKVVDSATFSPAASETFGRPGQWQPRPWGFRELAGRGSFFRVRAVVAMDRPTDSGSRSVTWVQVFVAYFDCVAKLHAGRGESSQLSLGGQLRGFGDGGKVSALVGRIHRLRQVSEGRGLGNSVGELDVGFQSQQLGADITATDPTTLSDESVVAALYLHQVCPFEGALSFPMKSGLMIGRAAECLVRVNAASVSRLHARIEEQGGLHYCIDLQSRNGTYFNGKQSLRAPVGPGDVIRCGDSVWVLSRTGALDGAIGIRELACGLFGGRALALALEPLQRFARAIHPIVIEGETGVGKEVAARALHQFSERLGPYVAVNCAAVTESLFEGELFGYRKGAFTGADRSHLGHFRAAEGGTLLLDEICELSLPLQAKLLRVLEQREVTPLGESRAYAIDVRVVSAAQRPLRDEVAQGRFREDLMMRLGTVVRVPPLRERIEDTPALFRRFLLEAMGYEPTLHARLIETLLLYRFPKNVRELRQLAEYLSLMYPGEPMFRRSHLPDWLLGAVRGTEGTLPPEPELTAPKGPRAVTEPVPRSEEPRRAEPDADWPSLLLSLQKHRGNVVRAAAAIGLSRHQAYRLLKMRPEISLEQFRTVAAHRSSDAGLES